LSQFHTLCCRRYVYCRIDSDQGYWGRDRGNDEGIRTIDKRTAVGVYPAGGKVTTILSEINGLTFGAAGAGITPIVLASTVDFWKLKLHYQAKQVMPDH
jgi:hypothetical protein